MTLEAEQVGHTFLEAKEELNMTLEAEQVGHTILEAKEELNMTKEFYMTQE